MRFYVSPVFWSIILSTFVKCWKGFLRNNLSGEGVSYESCPIHLRNEIPECMWTWQCLPEIIFEPHLKQIVLRKVIRLKWTSCVVYTKRLESYRQLYWTFFSYWKSVTERFVRGKGGWMQRKELRGWMRESLLSVVLPTKVVRCQFLFLSTFRRSLHWQ